ncbi:thioesterase family protein [Sneathiella sp. CAU 1612]|uniref:Thioesterase family protein n=1 Tax=Sneathiella sedimenti TaxID=2816034 RepID=A0ABS3F1U3_9PROT|nr:thioesterase family protein [Sneathiella sedimenti]MBO0332303.1 thioesterase family protein [Sneathiella sedimenti]
MSGYMESYRGQVLMRECDLLGHMNIQYYGSRISLAMCNMFHVIGLDPDDLKNGKRGLAVVHQDSRYVAELHAGDIIHMQSAVVGSSDKTVTIDHRLYNSVDDGLVFTSRMTSAYMDLESRKAIPLSDAIRQKVAELKIDGENAA